MNTARKNENTPGLIALGIFLLGPLVIGIVGTAATMIFNPPKAAAPAPATPESLVAEKDLAMVWACEGSIKKQLRDPDSYKYETVKFWPSTSKESGKTVTAVVLFRSKNGFGGYVSGAGECSFDANAKLVGSAIVS